MSPLSGLEPAPAVAAGLPEGLIAGQVLQQALFGPLPVTTAPPPPAIVAAGPQHLAGMRMLFNEIVAGSTAVYADLPESAEQRAAWLAQRQAAGHPVLVAEAADGGVLGFASFTDFRPCFAGFRHTAEHSVHLRPEARGQGLGRRLLEALLAEARAQGRHAMMASIDSGNAASLALHARLGFREVGRLPQVGCKFGRWLDLVLMQKLLDERPAPGG
ncbi:GNAT family N-acetyltransferase [Roseomonas sp. USHLN139]|uniref:GNAT family N-acetyltransferase n=1 Tax=Roseomonas sp. USHLN139 TaxID=3081298 RepID=UPI003B0147B4